MHDAIESDNLIWMSYSMLFYLYKAECYIWWKSNWTGFRFANFNIEYCQKSLNAFPSPDARQMINMMLLVW